MIFFTFVSNIKIETMKLSEIMKDDKKKVILLFEVLSVFFLFIGVIMLSKNNISGMINIIFGILSFTTSLVIKRDKKTVVEIKPEMSLEEKTDKIYKAILVGDKQTVKDILWSGIEINYEYKNGYTLFSLATDKKRYDIMKILIMYKADIDKIQPILGMTPLFIAVRNNDIESVRIILNHKVNTKTQYDSNALDLAESLKFYNIVELLSSYKNKNL